MNKYNYVHNIVISVDFCVLISVIIKPICKSSELYFKYNFYK